MSSPNLTSPAWKQNESHLGEQGINDGLITEYLYQYNKENKIFDAALHESDQKKAFLKTESRKIENLLETSKYDSYNIFRRVSADSCTDHPCRQPTHAPNNALDRYGKV